MTWTADLALIEREGRRIIEIGRGAPAATVPQYPTWTLRDLVVHVAGVHGRTATICRTLPRERIPTAELPSGRDAFEWADEQLAAMLEGLRTADPDAATWTFVADPCLRFWGPRMVVETGVHRWDAESAVGDPQPLSAEVSVHGLDEFGELYLPRLGDVPVIELGRHRPGPSLALRFGHPDSHGRGHRIRPVPAPDVPTWCSAAARVGASRGRPGVAGRPVADADDDAPGSTAADLPRLAGWVHRRHRAPAARTPGRPLRGSPSPAAIPFVGRPWLRAHRLPTHRPALRRLV